MPTTCDSVITLLLTWGGEVVAALSGAFMGASFAFFLMLRHEKTQRADKEYAAIIKAQHALFFMWRLMVNIQDNYLKVQRSDTQGRHRNLPTYSMNERYLPIDFDSIAFLFRPKMREVVARCFVAERQFLSACDAVTERNTLQDKITEEVEIAGMAGDKIYVEISKIDPRRDHRLKSKTDSLYVAVDQSVDLCEVASADLRRCAKEIFPEGTGHDFFKDLKDFKR